MIFAEKFSKNTVVCRFANNIIYFCNNIRAYDNMEILRYIRAYKWLTLFNYFVRKSINIYHCVVVCNYF